MRSKQAGFTIVEVVMGFVILAVVFTMTAMLENMGWFGTRHLSRMATASDMIAYQVDTMKVALQKTGGSAPVNGCQPDSARVRLCWENNGQAKREDGVTPIPDVWHITFTATWRNGLEMHTVNVPTYVAKNY